MNRVVEYLIRAKDATAAGIQSATAKLKQFVSGASGELKKLGNASKQAGNVASGFTAMAGTARHALPALTALGGAMGMMDGTAGKVARGISAIAGMTMMLGPVGAAIGAVQVAVGLFAEHFQEQTQKVLDRYNEMIARQKEYANWHWAKMVGEDAASWDKVAASIDNATKKLERQIKMRQALAQANEKTASAQEDAQLIGLEAQRDKELGGLDGREREAKAAEWEVTLAQKRAEIETARASRTAQAEKEAIADAEKRLSLDRQSLREMEKEAEERKRKYDDLYSFVKENDGWAGVQENDSKLKDLKAIADKAEQAVKAQREKILGDRDALAVLNAEQSGNAQARDNAVARALNSQKAAEINYSRTIDKLNGEIIDEEEKDRLEMLKEIEDENKRLADEQARLEQKRHAQALANARAEYQQSAAAQTQAESRLSAAKSAVSEAWGWYKDTGAMQAQIDAFKQQQEAEKKWEKDFERLKARRSDWRSVSFGELSASDEAVRQVALAKEEQAAAQKALDEIAENTAMLKDIADALTNEEEA